jgi:hypothetical protein
MHNDIINGKVFENEMGNGRRPIKMRTLLRLCRRMSHRTLPSVGCFMATSRGAGDRPRPAYRINLLRSLQPLPERTLC